MSKYTGKYSDRTIELGSRVGDGNGWIKITNLSLDGSEVSAIKPEDTSNMALDLLTLYGAPEGDIYSATPEERANTEYSDEVLLYSAYTALTALKIRAERREEDAALVKAKAFTAERDATAEEIFGGRGMGYSPRTPQAKFAVNTIIDLRKKLAAAEGK